MIPHNSSFHASEGLSSQTPLELDSSNSLSPSTVELFGLGALLILSLLAGRLLVQQVYSRYQFGCTLVCLQRRAALEHQWQLPTRPEINS